MTYKTAWRMFNLIRNQLMRRTTPSRCPAKSRWTRPTSVDGRAPRDHPPGPDVEGRQEGARVRHGPARRPGRRRPPARRAGDTWMPYMRQFVLPETTVYTGEHPIYDHQRRSKYPYEHRRTRHREKSTSVAAPTPRPSRGSSRSRRTASGASTTRHRPGGFRATRTSTRGATTAATTSGRCSSNSCCARLPELLGPPPKTIGGRGRPLCSDELPRS